MDWIHCNICFTQPSKEMSFSLTSCGHIYCNACLGNGTENGSCKVCKTNCNIIQLVPDMKPEVKEFFAEPEEILSKLMEVLDFQKQHRMKLTAHWITLNRKYKEEKDEVKRLRLIAEKIYGNLKQLYKENKMLKSALVSQSTGNNSPMSSLPMSHGNLTSTRSQVPQNTPMNGIQGLKSNLVTPLRIRQRYPVGNSGNNNYPLTNMSGNISGQPYGAASNFLTPPADTPGSQLKFIRNKLQIFSILILHNDVECQGNDLIHYMGFIYKTINYDITVFGKFS